MKDVAFHVADKSMEMGLRAFFRRADWASVLSCKPFDLDPENSNDIFRVPRYKDGGVWKYAHDNLALHRDLYRRTVVMLDEHFDPWPGAERIRSDIQANLLRSGWSADSVEVVVIRPMLEAWIWVSDNLLENAFGITSFARFRYSLMESNLWKLGNCKPNDLKTATDRAMVEGGKLTKGALFSTVFTTITKDDLDRCEEPGFNLLRSTLQKWFPANEGDLV